MQAFALLVQIVGALVTAFGLWQAWFKLLRGQSPWSWLLERLRRRRRVDQHISASSILSLDGVGVPSVWVEPPHDPTLPVEEQVVQLAAIVAHVTERVEADRQHIREVERSVGDLRSWVGKEIRHTRTAAKAKLDDHIKKRDEAQVLDLKLAVWEW